MSGFLSRPLLRDCAQIVNGILVYIAEKVFRLTFLLDFFAKN